MDDLAAVQHEIDQLGEFPAVTSLAMNRAIILLRGWYQNFKPTTEDMKTWVYLMRDLDPTLFITAAEKWGRTQPEWAPTGPQFRQIVEQLEADKRRALIREANVRRIKVSKAADRRFFVRTRTGP